MSLHTNTGILPRFSGARLRRGKYSKRSPLSLAAALYLLLALTVPGSFLIADDTTSALYGGHLGLGQQAPLVDHSPNQSSKEGDERQDSDHPLGAKRLRGLLESVGGALKVLMAIVVYEVPEIRPETADAGHRPVLVEREPQQPTPPPQFLQRPPPGN